MCGGLAEYAGFGSERGDAKCSLILAHCYAKGDILERNLPLARKYLELSCRQGIDIDGGIFISVKETFIKAEEEQAKIEAAKQVLMRENAARQQQRDEGQRMSRLLGFSDWLDGFVSSQLSRPKPANTELEGDVRPEQTATGIEYRFYSKDDPSRPVRIKNYDVFSGTGETYDGEKVKRKSP